MYNIFRDYVVFVCVYIFGSRSCISNSQSSIDVDQNYCQIDFSSGNSQLFKLYRSKVNGERKLLRVKFFDTKVSKLKKSTPRAWWSDIKGISGMKASNSPLQSQLQMDNIDQLSPKELANLIFCTFLKPMGTYQP